MTVSATTIQFNPSMGAFSFLSQFQVLTNSSRACCGSNVPCKRTRHRDTHHCDFPYAAFFEMARAINNYVDTVKLWGICQDKNLNDPLLDPQFGMSSELK